MDYKMHEQLLDSYLEIEKSMRVSVKIPRDEADRLIVTRLIEIRNSDVNRNKDMSHFDKVIKHYLTDDELEKKIYQK